MTVDAQTLRKEKPGRRGHSSRGYTLDRQRTESLFQVESSVFKAVEAGLERH